MKTIAVVTGNRSEYDILYAIIMAIIAHPELELCLVVTGAHLSREYGYTVTEIEEDGFPIAERVETLLPENTLAGRGESCGIGVQKLIRAFERLKPTCILVVGDREDAMAAALAGVYLNIAVVHTCGGDRVWGNVDDIVRHAITKLAHLHFPTTAENAERIVRMGEEPWRVHCVGNPGLDRFARVTHLEKSVLEQKLGVVLGNGPILVLVQHPLSSEYGLATEQMRITLEAVATFGHTTFVGMPNSDAGSKGMIAVIKEYADRHSFLKPCRNLPRVEFVNLLRIASALIGNSSCGILEAPMLHLPVINVGNRQKYRQHAENVLFVSHDKAEIISAIRKALNDKDFLEKVQICTNPYGDGNAAERIVRVLAETNFNNGVFIKDITY